MCASFLSVSATWYVQNNSPFQRQDLRVQANPKDTFMLEVTDVKQWTHCPRIVFYRYCLPHIRPITGKMEEGILRHNEERDREERRLLRSYGLTTGERFFDVPLRSPTLGVAGRLDLLIITPPRAAPEAQGIAVEYKFSHRNPLPHAHPLPPPYLPP